MTRMMTSWWSFGMCIQVKWLSMIRPPRMLPGRSMSNVPKTRRLPMHLGRIGKGMSTEFSLSILLFTRFRTPRDLLWQYFLPTIFEESVVTSEPTIGQTRIFKAVNFKLLLNCSTTLDVYFMNNRVGPFHDIPRGNTLPRLVSRNSNNCTWKCPRPTPHSKPSCPFPLTSMASNQRWRSTYSTLLLKRISLSHHFFERRKFQ